MRCLRAGGRFSGNGSLRSVVSGFLLALGACQAPTATVAEESRIQTEDPLLAARREYGKGAVAKLEGNLDLACHHFLNAVSLDENSVFLRCEVARVLLLAQQVDAAIVVLESARELEPSSALGLLELAEAYRKAGRPMEAIETLVALHQRRPDDDQPLMVLHALMLMQKVHESGLQLFRNVAENTRPHWPFAHEALGDFLLRSGAIEQAHASYQRALQLGARNTSIQRKLKLAASKVEARERATQTVDSGVRIPEKKRAVEGARPVVPSATTGN